MVRSQAGVTQLIVFVFFFVMVVSTGPFRLGRDEGGGVHFTKLAVLALEQRFCH